MSYSKKDEDADQAIVKVDRTAVFQEGTYHIPSPNPTVPLTVSSSSLVQLLSNISKKMSSASYQDRLTPFYRGDIPRERSHRPFLWNLEALPEQRPFSSPDDVPDI